MKLFRALIKTAACLECNCSNTNEFDLRPVHEFGTSYAICDKCGNGIVEVNVLPASKDSVAFSIKLLKEYDLTRITLDYNHAKSRYEELKSKPTEFYDGFLKTWEENYKTSSKEFQDINDKLKHLETVLNN